MAILDYPLMEADNPILYYGDVYLRYPKITDFEDWRDLRLASREHLEPVEPSWRDEHFTKKHYRKRLRLYARDIRAGTSRPYYIFKSETDELVGACILSNIRYLSAMTGTIGYWVGQGHLRKGYAYSAVCAAVLHAFGRLDLERLEAATLPENEASQSLLKKVGFEEEGFARNYLAINGERRDHVLFGLSPESCNQALQDVIQDF